VVASRPTPFPRMPIRALTGRVHRPPSVHLLPFLPVALAGAVGAAGGAGARGRGGALRGAGVGHVLSPDGLVEGLLLAVVDFQVLYLAVEVDLLQPRLTSCRVLFSGPGKAFSPSSAAVVSPSLGSILSTLQAWPCLIGSEGSAPLL
jgi:hypothetical protein